MNIYPTPQTPIKAMAKKLSSLNPFAIKLNDLINEYGHQSEKIKTLTIFFDSDLSPEQLVFHKRYLKEGALQVEAFFENR